MAHKQTLVRVVVAIALSMALAGCPEQITQLVVRLDTDLAVPCQIDHIKVDIDGVALDEITPVDMTMEKLPLQLPLRDGPDEPFEVTFVGVHDDTPVASQTFRFLSAFKSSKSLLYDAFLSAACGTDCEAIKVKDTDLHAYTDISAYKQPTKCPDASECDPECSAKQECLDHVCRDLPTVRYETRSGHSLSDACTADKFMDKFLTATDDPSKYLKIYDLSDDAPDMSFFFYGRRVYGMRIGRDGWISFNFDPDADDAPILDPANAHLSDGSVQEGLYAFWTPMGYTLPGAVCVSRALDSEDTSVQTELGIQWNLTCFAGTSCTNTEKIRIGVAFGAGVPDSDKSATLSQRAGTLQWSFLPNHQSNDKPELALHASEGADFVTIGLRDSNEVEPACTKCDLNGQCEVGGASCGFTEIGDPFETGFLRDGDIDDSVTPPRISSDGVTFGLDFVPR